MTRDTYSRKGCVLNKLGDIIDKLVIVEIRTHIKDVNKLVIYDKELKDHFRDYSFRGRAQRNTDYINFFDLQWLLFLEPENGSYDLTMKGYEIATSNFEKSPWALLYEYAQVQKLLMHVMRQKSEEDVIKAALDLCEHSLLVKKLPEQAVLFWNVILLYSTTTNDKFTMDGLFQVKRTEIHNLPHIEVVNPFEEFKIVKAILVTNGADVPLVNEITVIKNGVNNFPLIHYGQVHNIISTHSIIVR